MKIFYNFKTGFKDYTSPGKGFTDYYTLLYTCTIQLLLLLTESTRVGALLNAPRLFTPLQKLSLIFSHLPCTHLSLLHRTVHLLFAPLTVATIRTSAPHLVIILPITHLVVKYSVSTLFVLKLEKFG